MKTLGIKFKTNGPVYYFTGEEEYKQSEKVVVETDKGLQLGIVCENNSSEDQSELKKSIRIATEEDYNRYLKNLKDSKKALNETKELAKKFNLNMSFNDASYSLDRKILQFNFITDERVDFRKLVKELATRYHTRIELHQMGVRDKAKEIGGIGMCGRTLCCNNHLVNMGSVNINMVKNQNIALNPTKINGACGRLLCCFTYENCIYDENRKLLPKLGDKVNRNNKDGKVIEIDIINKRYKIKYNDNTIEEVDDIGRNK